MKKIGIKEIAKLAGVSPVTVSRVLNDHKDVKDETREKVKKILVENNYRPDYIAISMRTRKTKNIGLILGDIENPFYARVSRGVISTCEENDYNTIICDSRYDLKLSEKYIDMLINRGIDGLLIATVNITENSINRIKDERIPVVMLGCKINEPNFSSIMVDHYLGCKKLMEYMISLGHRKMLYLKCEETHDTNERFRAFKDSLKQIGIEDISNYSTDILANYKNSCEYINNAINKGNIKNYTAIIAENDYLAMGAIQAILENHLRIPEDISITGYDDLNYTRILNPPLTTVYQPKFILGKKGAEVLVNILKNPEKVRKPKEIHFKPELIIRESCRRV